MTRPTRRAAPRKAPKPVEAKPSLGDRIIRRANDGYHTRMTTGPKDYPPYALTPWDDRLRWSKYIKTIADEIEAEDALITPVGGRHGS